MAKEKIYEGGCMCGYIRFKAVGIPSNPHTCSCKNCQKHTGALTVAWVEFPKSSVQWNGEGGEPSKFKFSDHSKSSRIFCHKCGSSMGDIDDAPIVALILGSFDSPNHQELMPTSHSCIKGRPSWWHLDTKQMEC